LRIDTKVIIYITIGCFLGMYVGKYYLGDAGFMLKPQILNTLSWG